MIRMSKNFYEQSNLGNVFTKIKSLKTPIILKEGQNVNFDSRFLLNCIYTEKFNIKFYFKHPIH